MAGTIFLLMMLVVPTYTNTYDPKSIIFCARLISFLPSTIANGIIVPDMISWVENG